MPPPSIINTLLELRAGSEYVSGLTSYAAIDYLPRGDGHPVMVVPGFMANEISTQRLRTFLRVMGYDTFDWRQGRNVGRLGPSENTLLARIRMIHERLGKKPSVVGWSLGGVYARILAKNHPHDIRSVITLGSPLVHPQRSAIDHIYRRTTQQPPQQHPEQLAGINAAPAVPATSIYSRLDGIVNWRACLSEESPTSENIRVFGSHCGLGFQALVLAIVADRLAQPDGKWERFSWLNLSPV